jgi:hypothetical protein
MTPHKAKEYLGIIQDKLNKNFPEFKFMLTTLGHIKVTAITPPVESE